MYRLVLLLFVLVSEGKKGKKSDYFSKIDPNKKFLPKTFIDLKPKKVDDRTSELECKVRKLAYNYSIQIQPFRDDIQRQQTYDGLNIDDYCNSNNNGNKAREYGDVLGYHSNIPINSDVDYTVYVDPINGNDNGNGSKDEPYKTIYKAIDVLRGYKDNNAIKQIVIREGTVYMDETVMFTPETYDNNLLIRGYPGENATISGGILLQQSQLNWERYGDNSYNIWRTKLDTDLVDKLYNNSVFSLFTLKPHTRLTRARFPNGHVEVFQDDDYYLDPYAVLEWEVPPTGEEFEPIQIYNDLNCSNGPPCLNSSSDGAFDVYTAGYDNLCSLWLQSDDYIAQSSYWCGYYVGGGWSEQDQRMAGQGLRQLPLSMRYDTHKIPEIAEFGDDIATATYYIRHSQGWNVFWWEAGEYYDLKKGNITFGKGGYQGGRVWSATADLDPSAKTNVPIAAGGWYIENVKSALDNPTEWFFDKSDGYLYYWPNNTSPGDNPKNTPDLVIGNLSTLFLLQSSDHEKPLFNVTFMDLNFRDTRYTYMEYWGTPSGGDWALYNGGAFKFENTTNCSILSSSFTRLDGNCIALSGYNRNTTINRNTFQYIGDNIVGAWGYTKDWDGTSGLQPRFTYISENYAHDFGLYQLQSSLFFQAKSCQNYLYNNIVYNIPRAAILFNDAFGGSSVVENNLIWNTCTMSGDHGPINSWNRMPFLTKVAYGYPSFDAGYTNVRSNFVFANYGGSQSFDTDDGSAWYNISGNFFYDALAYKNDYGGYSVNYFNNINVALTSGEQDSWGIGNLNRAGPGNIIFNNKIVVFGCPYTPPHYCDINGQLFNQEALPAIQLYNNSYYTPNGNASLIVGYSDDNYYSLEEMRKRFKKCQDSTNNTVPSVDTIVGWAADLLNIKN